MASQLSKPIFWLLRALTGCTPTMLPNTRRAPTSWLAKKRPVSSGEGMSSAWQSSVRTELLTWTRTGSPWLLSLAPTPRSSRAPKLSLRCCRRGTFHWEALGRLSLTDVWVTESRSWYEYLSTFLLVFGDSVWIPGKKVQLAWPTKELSGLKSNSTSSLTHFKKVSSRDLFWMYMRTQNFLQPVC